MESTNELYKRLAVLRVKVTHCPELQPQLDGVIDELNRRYRQLGKPEIQVRGGIRLVNYRPPTR